VECIHLIVVEGRTCSEAAAGALHCCDAVGHHEDVQEGSRYLPELVEGKIWKAAEETLLDCGALLELHDFLMAHSCLTKKVEDTIYLEAEDTHLFHGLEW